MNLTPEHIEAASRQRRIIYQDDVLCTRAFRKGEITIERWQKIVDFYMSRLDAAPNQIDSVWHEWGEGNTAVWPSEVLPETSFACPEWWTLGIDPVGGLLEETKKRGRECFFSYRINGSDNDPLFDPPHDFKDPIPIKAEHPDWLIRKWHPFWDFTHDGVRDLKLAILKEVAEKYDYDGISIDFARIPVLFREGQQWTHRDLLTDFIRKLRTTLLEIESRRARPYLLAVRIPEDIPGCHFDGMDVVAWIAESLVDILVVGTRTANVDIPGFRNLTSGTEIRVYPSWDDHHSSDGYRHPSLDVWRGVCANWWRQNPDGMHTFNLTSPSPETHNALEIELAPRHRGGPSDELDLDEAWEIQRHVCNEVGSPESLEGLNKIFFVERRGGGHGEDFSPNPDNWYTPRLAYFQTNMRAPLPAQLLDNGLADTLLNLEVADPVNDLADAIDLLELRIAFTCRGEEDSIGPNTLADQLEVEVRVNNLLLDGVRSVEEEETALNAHFQDWLAYDVSPSWLAPGENLIGIRLVRRPNHDGPIRVEKVELHVRYGT